jgi:hypothetical protein
VYRIRSSSSRSFLQSSVTSSLFSPNILFSSVSNAFSRCSSHNVRCQVSHPHRTTGKIIVLYIAILCFLTVRKKIRGSTILNR